VQKSLGKQTESQVANLQWIPGQLQVDETHALDEGSAQITQLTRRKAEKSATMVHQKQQTGARRTIQARRPDQVIFGVEIKQLRCASPHVACKPRDAVVLQTQPPELREKRQGRNLAD